MPINKDFAHRLDILDACLRRHQRRWDAETLLEEINSQLEEKWGKKISRRTLFDDLKYLQDELQAPVDKYKEGSRVFYRYSEPDFSIKKLPLAGEDVGYLREAVQMLRQISNFSVLDDVEAIISKLEHTVVERDEAQVTPILFERHSIADGAYHLDDLLQAIKGRTTLKIEYQPFGASPDLLTFHPYLLREYRARWFVIGRKGEAGLATVLALDRMRSLKPAKAAFVPNDLFHPDTYYEHMIGVSLPEGEIVQEITIRVNGRQCYYIRTKPIHKSQQIIEELKENDCMIITLRLINNYELRSTLLSYGPDLEVLTPEKLRIQMGELFAEGVKRYQ